MANFERIGKFFSKHKEMNTCKSFFEERLREFSESVAPFVKISRIVVISQENFGSKFKSSRKLWFWVNQARMERSKIGKKNIVFFDFVCVTKNSHSEYSSKIIRVFISFQSKQTIFHVLQKIFHFQISSQLQWYCHLILYCKHGL